MGCGDRDAAREDGVECRALGRVERRAPLDSPGPQDRAPPPRAPGQCPVGAGARTGERREHIAQGRRVHGVGVAPSGFLPRRVFFGGGIRRRWGTPTKIVRRRCVVHAPPAITRQILFLIHGTTQRHPPLTPNAPPPRASSSPADGARLPHGHSSGGSSSAFSPSGEPRAEPRRARFRLLPRCRILSTPSATSAKPWGPRSCLHLRRSSCC